MPKNAAAAGEERVDGAAAQCSRVEDVAVYVRVLDPVAAGGGDDESRLALPSIGLGPDGKEPLPIPWTLFTLVNF